MYERAGEQFTRIVVAENIMDLPRMYRLACSFFAGIIDQRKERRKRRPLHFFNLRLWLRIQQGLCLCIRMPR